LKYHHHIGVINGIEWQASGLYPTRDDYVRQFGRFGASTPKGGILVYFELDPVVAALPDMNKRTCCLCPTKHIPASLTMVGNILSHPKRKDLNQDQRKA